MPNRTQDRQQSIAVPTQLRIIHQNSIRHFFGLGMLIEVEQEEDRLRTVEQRLSVSLEAYRARRDVLSAREKAAVAQVRAGQVMGGVAAGTAELNQALERAEENRKRIQARSLVINRLIESGVVEDPAEMSALDSASDHDVEQELQALKGQLLQQSVGGPAS